jgi:hypothetical protein
VSASSSSVRQLSRQWTGRLASYRLHRNDEHREALVADATRYAGLHLENDLSRSAYWSKAPLGLGRRPALDGVVSGTDPGSARRHPRRPGPLSARLGQLSGPRRPSACSRALAGPGALSISNGRTSAADHGGPSGTSSVKGSETAAPVRADR